MENFKSILFSVVGIIIIAALGLWAFSTIESGSVHVNNQRQKELEDQNKELNKQVTELRTQIGLLESEKANDLTANVATTPAPEQTQTTSPKKPAEKTTTPATVSKYQSLIDELQKLANANTYLKKGSTGTAVGAVQKFLNIYNNTSNKVDNDFGASTVTAVIKFQKDQGIPADGGVASGTLKKMIDWLKKK